MPPNETDIEALKRNPAAIRLYNSRVKLKKVGQEWEGLCPFHGEKTSSFRVSNFDGVWVHKCFGCGASGNIIQFVQKLDDAPFPQAVEKVRDFCSGSWEATKRAEKVFQPLSSNDAKKTFTLEQYAKLEQALAESVEAQTYLREERGIDFETAQRLRVGFKPDIGRIAGEKNADIADKGWLAFPSIVDEVVIGIKYRSIIRKAFCRQPGMATEVFNAQAIDPFSDLYVAEGEFDCASFAQADFASISIPSASTEVTPAMRDRMMSASRIILAGDSGEAGVKAMEKLWKELKDRTFLLRWPQGCKDANDFLRGPCQRDPSKFREEVKRLTLEAVRNPMPSVVSLRDAMLAGVSDGTPADDPLRMYWPWKSIEDMVILPPGSVFVLSASRTGTGKSTFINQVLLYNAMERGHVCLNYQCESNAKEVATLVTANLLKKDRAKITSADMKLAAKLMGNAKYYVGSDPSLTRVNEVLDLLEAAIRRLGLTLVVLDHIHYACRNEPSGGEVTAQANAMQRIVRMAKTYGTIFGVVAQPKNPSSKSGDSKEKAIDMSEIKGSETIKSDASAVLIMNRKKTADNELDPVTEIRREKARFLGKGKAVARLLLLGDLATFGELDTVHQEGI